KFQVDYKRSEVRSGPTPPTQMCACAPPIFFPTPPSSDSTPAAPPADGKDTVQFGAYYPWPWLRGDEKRPIMSRVRLTITNQHIDTVATYLNTSTVATRLSGREQSVGIE